MSTLCKKLTPATCHWVSQNQSADGSLDEFSFNSPVNVDHGGPGPFRAHSDQNRSQEVPVMLDVSLTGLLKHDEGLQQMK